MTRQQPHRRRGMRQEDENMGRPDKNQDGPTNTDLPVTGEMSEAAPPPADEAPEKGKSAQAPGHNKDENGKPAKRGNGPLKDGIVVEYDENEDGTMVVVSPPRMAGMTLIRRNDGGKGTPGSLKLVGKPPKA